MPRHARVDYPGAFNHVMHRGVAGFSVFPNDTEKFVFLERARKEFDGVALKCLVWTLMTNHSHLVSRTEISPLATGMQRLGTSYAGYFNRKHQRQGHVFQNRYKSLLIEDEMYLLRAVRYVLLNPIEAGLVDSLDELESYPWTSYPELLGRRCCLLGDAEFTLQLFAGGQDAARRELRAWLLDGITNPDPFGRLVELSSGRPPKELEEELNAAKVGERDSYVVGNPRFITSVLGAANAPKSAFPGARAHGWEVETLIEHVCERMGVSAAELCAGRKTPQVSAARAVTAWIAVVRLGTRQTDVARFLGVSRQAIGNSLARGEAIASDCMAEFLSGLPEPEWPIRAS